MALAGLQLTQEPLRHPELHLHRINIHQGGQGGVAGNDLAGADQAGPRETVKRGRDLGVLHLLAHQVQVGFVGLIAGRRLVVFLLGDGVVFQHEVGPLAIQFGQPEIGLGLFHGGLQFAGVEFGEHGSLLDRLALFKFDGVHRALHLALHFDGLVRIDGGHQRDAFLQGSHAGRFRAHLHGRARGRATGPLLFITATLGGHRHGQRQTHRQPCMNLHEQPSLSFDISRINLPSKSK
jgi:hypothetical protein